MVAVAATYTTFGVHTAVLRVRRPGSPCGCLGSTAVSWGVVTRAWTFAAGAAAATLEPAEGAAVTDRLTEGCAAGLMA